MPFDEAKARVWLEKAARQNYDTAMLDYASWLIDGIGGKKDYEGGFCLDEARRRKRQCRGPAPTWPGYMKVVSAPRVTLSRRRHGMSLPSAPGLQDAKLDDLLDGLTDEEMKKAIELANRLK